MDLEVLSNIEHWMANIFQSSSNKRTYNYLNIYLLGKMLKKKLIPLILDRLPFKGLDMLSNQINHS